MFISIYVYYRVQILGFAIIAAPLFKLLRKNTPFKQTNKEKQAIEHLKQALTLALALILINYLELIRQIILIVNSSKKGQGAVIMQLNLKGYQHLIQFKSRVQSIIERNQDSSKYKYKALLLTLKKFRLYIYRVQFIIEIDAKTLIAQLQRSAIDLLGALITYQLALLNIQDFNIVYVVEKKNIIANALLRQPKADNQVLLEELEDNVEDFINTYLNRVQLVFNTTLSLQYSLCRADLSFNNRPLDRNYSKELQAITIQILFQRRPKGLIGADLQKFKKRALGITV